MIAESLTVDFPHHRYGLGVLELSLSILYKLNTALHMMD